MAYGHDTISDFSFRADKLAISGFDEGPQITVTKNGFDLDFGDGDVLSVEVAAPYWMPFSQAAFNAVPGRWIAGLLDI